MALLNSQAYAGLSGVSSGQSKRQPGKFLSVFITGEMRPNQEMGKMQVMPEIGVDDYIYHNASEIYFIPLFIKRVWEKYIPATNAKGDKYDQLVAFGGWTDEQKLDDQCRYVYYIAGLGLDTETKKVKTHSKDIEANEIKNGDKILIHFRCAATKYQGAMDLMDELGKKSKTLPPLSDNIEFERLVVTPRRFIVKASIGIHKTENYGNKAVFKFEPVNTIPDKMVENIMNISMELTPDFEKQFKTNKENQIRSKSSGTGGSTPAVSQSKDLPTFDKVGGEKEEEKAQTNVNVPKEDFDLGL